MCRKLEPGGSCAAVSCSVWKDQETERLLASSSSGSGSLSNCSCHYWHTGPQSVLLRAKHSSGPCFDTCRGLGHLLQNDVAGAARTLSAAGTLNINIVLVRHLTEERGRRGGDRRKNNACVKNEREDKEEREGERKQKNENEKKIENNE